MIPIDRELQIVTKERVYYLEGAHLQKEEERIFEVFYDLEIVTIHEI